MELDRHPTYRILIEDRTIFGVYKALFYTEAVMIILSIASTLYLLIPVAIMHLIGYFLCKKDYYIVGNVFNLLFISDELVS